MKEFDLEVEEILQRVVTIKAETEDEALQKLEDKYYNEEIILDHHDLKETTFKVIKINKE